MRTHKGLIAVIGIALLLQACGSPGPVETNSPAAIDTVSSVATDPSATELATNASAPAGEFFSSIPFRTGVGFRGSWLELYFIDPTNPFAQREVGSVDANVAASIVAAKQSVDVSLRTLRLESITDALISVSERDIPVRIVVETDSLANSPQIEALVAAGIPIVDDRQPGLLNGTFIVIDNSIVWTGSVDFDLDGVYRTYNAAIRISSPEVAADYTKEFEEMFLNNQFGKFVVPETPHPTVDIQGTQVEVLFSPDDLVLDRLTQLVNEAQESIYFLSYAFGSEDLGKAIRAKAAEGVTVAGVLEFDQVNPTLADPESRPVAELDLFREAGLDIRLERGPELMNHKIMIIDEKIVVLGSYDFTNRAENENDENVLIIHDERVAQKFMEEFQRVQSRAQQ
jgi:phosphatidylserine/phosphatidylglycerophosphate/cardiolipin synthase-like enzyme